MPELTERLRSPEARRLVLLLALGGLTLLALQLRLLLDVEGVLDIDAVNFGLAAFDFDVLRAQPHPPGYPGYVVLLKLVHLAAPSLDPLAVAKWTTRLSGAAGVPAAYWACARLLAFEATPARPLLRPLAAGLIAALHPLLWYYGADGQSHAAEATGTFLLVGAAAWAVHRPSPSRALLLAAAFAIAGALRPPLPLLLSPLLLWALWRQPLRVWLLSALVGAALVAAYLLPTLAAAGGWDLYRRATLALTSELFVARYSPFGARASWPWIQVNLNLVVVGTALALLPALAAERVAREAAPATRSFRRLAALIVLLTVAFYALLFARELGYFSGLAALAALTPASWRAAGRLAAVRRAAVLVGLPALVLLGPDTIPGPFSPARSQVELPTLAQVVGFEKAVRFYRDATCRHASPRGTLVLSDSLVATHTRVLPHLCKGIVAGVLLFHPPLRPALDNWVFYTDRTLVSVPTPVPLELGPPAAVTLPFPVARVIVGQDASPRLLDAVARSATCAPLAGPRFPEAPAVFPARCLPELRVGRNRIRLTPRE